MTSPTELKPGDKFFLRNDNYLDDLEFVVLKKNSMGPPIDRVWVVCLCIGETFGKQPYNTNNNTTEWEHSYLRRYLNDREIIDRIALVENLCHFMQSSIDGMHAVIDTVSLLSSSQVDRYYDILCGLPDNFRTWLSDDLSDVGGYLCGKTFNPKIGVKNCFLYTDIQVHPIINMNVEKLNLKTENGKIIIYY